MVGGIVFHKHIIPYSLDTALPVQQIHKEVLSQLYGVVVIVQSCSQ